MVTEMPQMPEGGEDLARRAAKALYPYLRHAQLVVSNDGHPLGVRHLLGTEAPGGEAAMTPEERSGRCFELSAYAVGFPGIAPVGTRLVHGSIHGPKEDHVRIGHAWLTLPENLVWEPYTSCIYDRDLWYEFSRAWEEVTMTLMQARMGMHTSGHFGPWHDTRYPTKPAKDEE